MKIGLIVPGFSADEGDWCIPALLNLARSLASSNEIHVFALRYPHRRDLYRVHGITVHSFGGATRRGIATGALWKIILAAIRREHRQAPFAVLHAVYGGEAGFLNVLAAKWLGVRSVVSFVGGEVVGIRELNYGADLQPRQRWMNATALCLADRILCASRPLTLRAHARVPTARRARIQTLPLGVDVQMFAPRARREKGTVEILNVGSLIPVKDQATLLHAFAQFANRRPRARLTLVGRGALELELRALAERLQIVERVEFAGAVPHDEMPERYHRADLFVQSSRHEGEGMAALEAGACATPLASTDVGAMAELTTRGAAVVVPPNDPRAFASAMEEALAARVSLGNCAREVIETEYALERVRDRLLSCYHSLTPGRIADA